MEVPIKLSNSEIIRKLNKLVKQYDTDLNNKLILMVYKETNKESALYLEIQFKAEHFLHLTGVQTKLKPNEFYKNLQKGVLSEKNISSTNYTEMKLRALTTLICIGNLNCQIGTYKGNRHYLQADMIVGKRISIMGLVKTNNFYMPRTVIEEKIPNIINSPQPTIATFKRSLGNNEKYKITYINSKYDFEKYKQTLPEIILSRIE